MHETSRSSQAFRLNCGAEDRTANTDARHVSRDVRGLEFFLDLTGIRLRGETTVASCFPVCDDWHCRTGIGQGKAKRADDDASPSFAPKIYIALRLGNEKHIPGPTAGPRAVDVFDFRTVAKLVAILVRPFRFFVLKLQRRQSEFRQGV